MRKVVVYSLVSVDGVAQDPEEFVLDFDAEMEANLAEVIGAQDTVLLGRRMYDQWSEYWPRSDDQPFADFINTVQKFVATSTALARAWTNAEAVVPGARSTTRFSTCPSSPTITASARPGLSGTKLICRSTSSARGTRTSPAQADRPDKAAVVAASASSTGPERTALPSIAARSSALGSATRIMPSTNSRNPISVGIRPALVCGWLSNPSASSSAMTLRIEAGDRAKGRSWDNVRDPTGSPDARKASTRWRKTSRGRSVKPCGISKGLRGSRLKTLKYLAFLFAVAAGATSR